ncbi:MAG TPA: ATP-dependent sacrificial sulfur transferase LarE [Patescibacteria group bacterium]|nr:ATP-dependent sacrificial sulfur transferase LarE [Patescibacteria group bacterium]
MNGSVPDAERALVFEVTEALPERSPVLRKFNDLVEIVGGLGSCVVAVSGGIDSTLLLEVASRLLGDRTLGVTGESAALPVWDREDARAAGEAAAKTGAQWRIVSTRELDDPRYVDNPRSRCFFCKSEIYGVLQEIAGRDGFAFVVDGTNASDITATDRPGMTAGRNLGVRSPLAEAGMTKSDVRAVARALGMRSWDRPASACLASRIPFGSRITPERLRRVERAELAIRARGYRQVRVRDLGAEARVEVDARDVGRLRADRKAIDVAVRSAGFSGWAAAMYGVTSARDDP